MRPNVYVIDRTDISIVIYPLYTIYLFHEMKLGRFKVKKDPGAPQSNKSDYMVNGKIWVEKNGELYLGGGRIILLERIEKLGSVAAAARSMNLGYRNAWLWIEAVNRLAPNPLVIKNRGGDRGGYAVLTKEGRKAVSMYRQLSDEFQKFIKKQKGSIC